MPILFALVYDILPVHVLRSVPFAMQPPHGGFYTRNVVKSKAKRGSNDLITRPGSGSSGKATRAPEVAAVKRSFGSFSADVPTKLWSYEVMNASVMNGTRYDGADEWEYKRLTCRLRPDMYSSTSSGSICWNRVSR